MASTPLNRAKNNQIIIYNLNIMKIFAATLAAIAAAAVTVPTWGSTSGVKAVLSFAPEPEDGATAVVYTFSAWTNTGTVSGTDA